LRRLEDVENDLGELEVKWWRQRQIMKNNHLSYRISRFFDDGSAEV
jgi:hypothetical protein